MNPVLVDPDVKINMSLDEVIHLSRDQISSQLSWKKYRGFSRRKRNERKQTKESSDHSVPLLSLSGGVRIYVSKNSSLLNAEHRRRIAQSFSNRAINSALRGTTKEIIPPEYKSIGTNCGVGQVLVPPQQYLKNSSRKKLLPLRKLNKHYSNSYPQCMELLPDKPPPLIPSLIYSPPCPPEHDLKMDVDESSDEIVILDNQKPEKQLEMSDVESDLPVDVVGAKRLCVTAAGLMPHGVKTLSDHFTMLTGSFQF